VSGVIVNNGDPAINLFLVLSGSVKYYRLTKDGEEVLLWWLFSDDIFGLGSLLSSPVQYVGTAEAVEDCELLVWERKRIRKLAVTYPALAENALRIILHYLSAYADRVVGLTTQTAAERLACTLFDLAERKGHVHPHGVELSITNQDLGYLANVSAFTASRQLNEWERQGLIHKTRKSISIPSPEALLTE
jgi:CRP-like cAMP-binding protein